ncbi:bifunctional apoptosis regulator-like isoform X2 [Cheilinus undulatus]|uniref:bifunctional apoptosis regulator-like isoform X2 n=1 Tax=Cheilinus undulatus TaxID=241271 RepID=UPI001BD25942|nr:bifunctional apoptosis regulator-like isoform X2 [Cheilinus undulatus]
MDSNSTDKGLEDPQGSPGLPQSNPSTTTTKISAHEFSCHCCYDILVNPTTLTCGHNFCRHCLAIWWESSHKNECPECREKWEGFPKVNFLLRYGDNKSRARIDKNKGAGFFFSGVLFALTWVAVVVLVYHWGSGMIEQHDPLITKPVARWTTEEVSSWLENLGPWAQNYREAFQQESVNGRLLLMLEEEELLKPPYSIENQAHRRAVLAELDRVKTLGVKPPQNLWEYKAANAGKSLFLLYAMKHSPRLTLFYLYLFDYSETFLPFLHTCCPAGEQPMESSFLNSQLEPNWQQKAEFLVKYFLLPYQLIAEFAWDWLAVHYWTSRYIIVYAVLLSMVDSYTLWRLLTTASIRTLPRRMWSHLWKMISQGFAFVFLWPIIPQFVCDCLFYWALYFTPIINIDLLVQQLLHPETQEL